jgi:hypothetical protein
MKAQEIIEIMLDELDPHGKLGDSCNVGLCLVANDDYHAMTLGDLRQALPAPQEKERYGTTSSNSFNI